MNATAWDLPSFSNVSEWVADGYSPGAYAQAPLADPYTAPTGHVRVVRGGAWGGITGGSTDAWYFVRRHSRADPRSVNDDAYLGGTVRDRPSDSVGKIRIVDGTL